MDDLKLVYEAINAIWRLRKRYAPGQLEDAEWEQFTEEGRQLQTGFAKLDPDVDSLFRDWFRALQKYYSRKETREK